MNIFITEEITDSRRDIENVLHKVGYVHYRYKSPTHWSSSGACSIRVDYDFEGNVSFNLDWASGGINKGFTDVEIADAMSKAFALASNRLSQLKQEQLEQENRNAIAESLGLTEETL
jgi:hypothetical protein